MKRRLIGAIVMFILNLAILAGGIVLIIKLNF